MEPYRVSHPNPCLSSPNRSTGLLAVLGAILSDDPGVFQDYHGSGVGNHIHDPSEFVHCLGGYPVIILVQDGTAWGSGVQDNEVGLDNLYCLAGSGTPIGSPKEEVLCPEVRCNSFQRWTFQPFPRPAEILVPVWT